MKKQSLILKKDTLKAKEAKIAAEKAKYSAEEENYSKKAIAKFKHEPEQVKAIFKNHNDAAKLAKLQNKKSELANYQVSKSSNLELNPEIS